MSETPVILAILQARVSSTRLPFKILKPILGQPMLIRQLERVKRSKRISALVVATSNGQDDDVVETICSRTATCCYRGSLDDVLDRFYKAALPHNPTRIVRLTGDCPLADWRLIDKLIDFAAAGDFDYASNTIRPTWPDGLDVEVFSFRALQEAWREAQLPSEREHVTPFIYKQSARYKLGNLEHGLDLSTLRWTVDDQNDFTLVDTIYKALFVVNPDFSTDDILAFLEQHGELSELNAASKRNEGLKKSEAADVFSQTSKDCDDAEVSKVGRDARTSLKSDPTRKPDV